MALDALLPFDGSMPPDIPSSLDCAAQLAYRGLDVLNPAIRATPFNLEAAFKNRSWSQLL